jgi:hypothetical protein
VHLPFSRPRAQLVGQAALADPGFAGDEDEPTVACERAIQSDRQGDKFLLPPDEDRVLG